MNREEPQWMISKTKKNEEEYYLNLLKQHFEKVTLFEKHPDAMLNLIFTDTLNKVLGKNFNKQRISKRKEKKIRELLTEKLRNRYGKWISLSLKFKSPDNALYRTNFNRVYKIKSLGIIYGSPIGSFCDGLFFTSHSFERFEERIPMEVYEFITKQIKEKNNETSIADAMLYLISTSDMEYSFNEQNNIYYFNIRCGILVIENLGNISIVKTFLTPDMIKEMTWKQFLTEPGEIIRLNSFYELLQKESINISKPRFLIDDMIEILLKYINFLK